MAPLFALVISLPSLADAQSAPFISTDPAVVCTTLEVVGGVALFEGDIAVGECEELAGGGWEFRPAGELGRSLVGAAPDEPADLKDVDPSAGVKRQLARRWPDGIVPYEIDETLSDSAAPDVYEDIREAIRHWADGTFVRLVPRSDEAAYVRFRASPSSCSSSLGRLGGLQDINLIGSGACGFGATVHEIGHAVGFFHEQSRTDRDAYITINFANISPGHEHNFRMYSPFGGIDVGLYDYGSIMHYSSTGFSSNGLATIDVDPVQLAAYQAIYGDVNIGNRAGLSILDRAAVQDVMNTCYAGAPANGAYWATSPWSACSASCGNPGQTRVVSCHRRDGVCSDDDVCSGLAKPADQRSCDPFVAENFELGPGAWDTLGTQDEFDWTFGIRGTPSFATGPTSDHTLGNGNDGWYAFIEASSPRLFGDEAHLTSAPFVVPASGAPAMSFWYHTQGSGIAPGSLEVEVTTTPCAGAPATSVLWSADGTSTSEWRQASVSLSAYTGMDVQLRFVGTVTSTSSDVALDDIDFHVGCGAAPDPSCDTSWGSASLVVKEDKVGKEKIAVTLAKGPALTQSDLGTPLDAPGTTYTLCVFDAADGLVAELTAGRASTLCGDRDCWRALGALPPEGTGYLYKDKERSADGIRLIKLRGGPAGKSSIVVRGSNNTARGYDGLPTGLAASLSGSPGATVELHGDNLEGCFAAHMDEVRTDTGDLFKAKK